MWIRLFLAVTLCGCASNELLRSADYESSRKKLAANQPQLALSEFPKKHESGGFLTTVETGYLNLLGHSPAPQPLVKISDQLDKREVISVSTELSHYFYQEAEDGYLPAEHEVIWMHLITGLSFAAQNDRAKARVEAQRAAQLLQGHYSERTGDFDDPGLRLILAGLWIYCQEWQHARVDLRRAAEMDARYQWAKTLAERSEPPKNLQIIFIGVGPEPLWNPNTTKAKLTGIDSLNFNVDSSRQKVVLTHQNGKTESVHSPLSTAHWYTRHQQRNHAIRDVVSGSRYLTKAAGQGAYTGTGMALSKVTAGTIMAAGIGVGIALVVGAFKMLESTGGPTSSSDGAEYIAAVGLGIATYGISEAKRLDRQNMKALKQDWNETMDPAPSYRYLRFLPDQIYASHLPETGLKLMRINGLQESPFLTLVSQDSTVEYYFAN